MGREDKAKQAAKGRGRSVLPTKNASITGEEGRMRTLCRVATFIVVGISLFAGGCATRASAGASHSASSASGRGALGGFPGKCMGGAGGTRSGSTASGMGSCASE